MIRVGELENPRMAQAFVDYLHTRQIQARVRPDAGHYVIWLEDESAAGLVEDEFNRFLSEPTHPRYQVASWHRSDDPGVTFRYRGEGLLQKSFLSHGGWLTRAVLILCGGIYLLWLAGWQQPLFNALAYQPTLEQPWRLLTPAFIHFSGLHITFNLLWWWYLGGQVERVRGSGRLLMLLLIAAIFSNTAQFLVSGNNFGGLSGVVYALAGYVWLTGYLRSGSRIFLPNAYFIFMLAWLVFGYLDLFGPQMANTAHTFGLLGGLLLALWDKRQPV